MHEIVTKMESVAIANTSAIAMVMIMVMAVAVESSGTETKWSRSRCLEAKPRIILSPKPIPLPWLPRHLGLVES